MKNWKNESGKQLSSDEWLRTHHNAKLQERTEFVKKNIKSTDKIVIDIGCGSGLWMELFASFLSEDCRLIGVDSDEKALEKAKLRMGNSNCHSSFINCNVEDKVLDLPKADLILLFNMSCYIKNLDIFLEKLRMRLTSNGRIIVRQYDGSNIRIGPMEEKVRKLIDNSLFSSLYSSSEFHHYDLDRVFEAIGKSSFSNKKIEMETYFKKTPYTKEVLEYLEEHIRWTSNYISEKAKMELQKWMKKQFYSNSYCSEVDLIAILS
ncbi:class I SAM-dependent methyltransferase [Thomasclavelia cocleata]|uniref:class I SAM-dependent methyltransferase n=1 Tax=Thomasclavelia cocleata TaxID=69824 RepID=UPI00258BA614|nr:class I SAM-dependent methyltransferase [Thomasclavelia cocleata]